MKKYKLSTALALSAFMLSPANGAVILDPTLASGPGNVIDPPGGQDVNQNFGTAQATLEARTDLRVLQDFTGFTAGDNIASFTVTTLPDIQFAWTGNPDSGTGANSTNVLFGTSEGSALVQRSAGSVATSSTLTISFGTWDGSAFTANQSVGAAGFTLSHLYTGKSGTVTFRDSLGNALAGAGFGYLGLSNEDGGGSSGNHRDIYFGWDSTAETTAEIGSITITFVDSAAPFTSGFDDLAFTTVIPEPSTALLGGLGLLALLRRRR